tara:strand:- start:850 stop:1659 length:810 start_codon:yes stop_codon:yes gene_type:complete
MNTTVVIVSYKSEHLIEENIKSYSENTKIIIIENSQNYLLKDRIEKKYKNVEVILNENSGFAQAANLGAKLTKTENIFFCSPDNFTERDTINKLEDFSKKLDNEFGILILSDENECPNTILPIKETRGMLCFFVKKEVFLNLSGFDEKFFLYYEDNDLVRRTLEKNLKIYQVPIKYSNRQGSHNEKFNHPVEVNRNWHLMWSKFYYKKKYKGYIYSFISTIPYLIRSLIRLLIYINNPIQKEIYLARISGLYNSYILKDPWYRPKIKKK